MKKHLFGLGSMLIGAGLMFVLMTTCSVTYAQQKTADQIREEKQKVTDLIKKESERKAVKQKLEDDRRRAAEQKLEDDKRRAAERVRREQIEEKAAQKRLKEQEAATFIKNNDVPNSCICTSVATVVVQSQLIRKIKPMHCYCGNLDCIVGDNHSSCVKRRR